MPGLISIQGATGLDSDNDGLPDTEELRLGTNPHLADTDGDGYNDGVEVRLGTDPTSANSRPEALSIYTAVELEMVTLTSRQYQFEISTNLNTWTPYGNAFPGTGSVSNKLISIKGIPTTYWRLRVLP